MKPRWLDHAVVYGVKFTLCTSQDMYAAEFKRITKYGRVPGEQLAQWCGGVVACVHKFDGAAKGDTVAIVCIDPEKTAGMDGMTIAALLAHEAVHVKQEIMRHIGEREPGDEIEAYVVQNVVDELLHEYARQTMKDSRR